MISETNLSISEQIAQVEAEIAALQTKLHDLRGQTSAKEADSKTPRPPMYGAFDTHDHPMTVVAGLVDEWWGRLMTIPELRPLDDDPRFQTMAGRREHREALNALLADCLLTKTRAEWIDLFSEQRILCGPVYTYEELFA